jgi:Bacterial PH domain
MADKCQNCGSESSGRFCPECGHDKGASDSAITASASMTSAAAAPARIERAASMDPTAIPVDSSVPIAQLQGRFKEIQAGTVTARGSRFMTDEGMVWEDKPSVILITGLVAKYLIAMVATLWLFSNIPNSSGAGTFLLLLFVVGAIHVGLRFWEIHSTKYRMTSQRLEVTAGLFNQRTVTYELHQMGAGQITRPFLLRLVKTGNLSLGALQLKAIRNPEVVRDMLRDFGQREASRLDKIRWR